MSKIMLFTGNANPKLSEKVADHLYVPRGKAFVGNFSDGEIMVEINENVRGRDVFVIQSTCAPTNTNLMEIMILSDALHRASAGKVTAVIPYFGYARQDRRPRSARVPITAKVVADMLSVVNIHRILTVDLHADQIQGFFDIPVDNIYSTPIFLEDIEQKKLTDITIVSPDHGGVMRARAIAKRLNTDLAIIDKRRPSANKAEIMNIIGDINGRNCILVDDMVDTAGTLVQASVALKEQGALSVCAYCTHPVLSGKALDNILQSQLDELVVTNTILLNNEALKIKKIRQLDMSFLIAESIRRISHEESISEMFHW